MKTLQFFKKIEGKKTLFNLPENRTWAEADREPGLTIDILDGNDEALILADGSQVEVENITTD